MADRTHYIHGPLPRGLVAATIWLAVLAPSLAGAAGLRRTGAFAAFTGDAPAAGSFRLVATHPDAARQPTELGGTLSTLAPWRGRLYPGYGDYTENTGPIAVSPFDPASGAFHQAWVADTESIENYRAIGDKLYAPAIDPRSKADYAVGEPWKDVQPVGALHAYDMATLNGRDLWLVGSGGNDAVAWRSEDGGANWQEVLRVAPAHGMEGDYARFYFVGVLANKLFVQATDILSDAQPRSRVFDGTGWRSGPNLLPRGGTGWRPVVFNGQLLFHSTELAGFLSAFDGLATKYMVGWSTWDVTLDGDSLPWLYVLRSVYNYQAGRLDDPVVMRTADLAHWEALSPAAPRGARSLARLGGKLYVGGRAGQLFVHDGAESWAASDAVWNHVPAVGAVEPSAADRLIAPATVPIRVHATDPDGPVASVKVWRDLDVIGEDSRPPFLILWHDVPAGRHELRVRATDSANAFSEITATVTVVDGANSPPTISRPPSADPNPAFSFAPIQFKAAATDADRDPLSFDWDFGDGAGQSGNPVGHIYTSYGNYPVTLTVSDGRGGVVQGRVDLTVDEGLPPEIYLPVAGRQSLR